MAYCRWSSEDWTCDVYVYAHVDGHWQIEIAAKRRVFDQSKLPPPVEDPSSNFVAWFERSQKVDALIKDAELVPIDHPEAGGWLSPATPGECAEELERLKQEGFNVPQHVIDALREEERDGP